MKKYLTLMMFLISINLQSQTNIEEFNPPTPKIILPPIIPYDSLTRIDFYNDGYDPIKFYQNNKYIGQKIFLTPNSDVVLWSKKKTKYYFNEIGKTFSPNYVMEKIYSGWSEAVSEPEAVSKNPLIETYVYYPAVSKINFNYNDKSLKITHNTSDSVSNRYFTISNFYYNKNIEYGVFNSTMDSILNIPKDDKSSASEELHFYEYEHNHISIVELIDGVSGDTVYSFDIDANKWISTGYYEKLKQLFEGKEIIFSKLSDFELISKKDNVIDIGKEFLCIGIK